MKPVRSPLPDGRGKARFFLILSLILAAVPAAAECLPEGESRASVVSRGSRAGPLTIAPGRLCADLGGKPPPADIQIGVGIGDFGGSGASSLYNGNDTGRAPLPGAGPGRR